MQGISFKYNARVLVHLFMWQAHTQTRIHSTYLFENKVTTHTTLLSSCLES